MIYDEKKGGKTNGKDARYGYQLRTLPKTKRFRIGLQQMQSDTER